MDAIKKLLSIIEYTIGKLVKIFFICLYLLVGSVGLVIMAGLSYGAVKETIKYFNPPPKDNP